jgi:hypothetical protein
MSNTIVEIFVNLTPVHLFRGGSKSSPRLDKLRTMPPRQLGEAFDIAIYDHSGTTYVKKDSGGISTLEKPTSGFADHWWRIPKGTKIPLGLRISRDYNPKPGIKPTHYSIRPLSDMPLSRYISLLQELARSAELMADLNAKKGAK